MCKVVGYLGMPAAPFDATRHGLQDKSGGRSAEKGVPYFWKKSHGSASCEVGSYQTCGQGVFQIP
jgi:hypothetical protein